MITSDEAARLFIDRMTRGVYHETYNGIVSLLSEGLPGRVDDPFETEKWYKGLDETHKAIIHEMIRASIIETIFNVMVYLDNLKGGYPARDQVSDFALYLQIYSDRKEMANNQPQEKVRFNSINDDELHDLFMMSIDEFRESR